MHAKNSKKECLKEMLWFLYIAVYFVYIGVQYKNYIFFSYGEIFALKPQDIG